MNKVIAGICRSDFYAFTCSLLNKNDGSFCFRFFETKKDIVLRPVHSAYKSYFSDRPFEKYHLSRSLDILFTRFNPFKDQDVLTLYEFNKSLEQTHQMKSNFYAQLVNDFSTSLCALEFTKWFYALFQNCNNVFDRSALKSIKFELRKPLPTSTKTVLHDDCTDDLSSSSQDSVSVRYYIERLNSQSSLQNRSDDDLSRLSVSSTENEPFVDMERFFKIMSIPRDVVKDVLQFLLKDQAKNNCSLDELNQFIENLVNGLLLEGVVKYDSASPTYFLFDFIKNKLLVKDSADASLTVKKEIGFLRAHYFLSVLAQKGMPSVNNTFKQLTDQSICRLILFYCCSWLKQFTDQEPDLDFDSISSVRQLNDFFSKLNALVFSEDLLSLKYIDNMKDKPFSNIRDDLINLLPIPQFINYL